MPKSSYPIAQRIDRLACWLIAGAVGSIVLVYAFFVLLMNDGNLVYLYDDAYIHLSVAEMVSRGVYGINLGEPSSPCSSFLWPLLLSPFARFSFGAWAPLLANAVALALSAWIFSLFLLRSLSGGSPRGRILLLVAAVSIYLLLTDGFFLAFSGLEHSLQCLISITILWGLCRVSNGSATPWFLPVACILGPLIRYEGAALTILASLYLWVIGRRRASAVSVLVPLGVLAGFSLFLLSSDLGGLPTSLVAKSQASLSHFSIGSVLQNLHGNILSKTGGQLLPVAMALLGMSLLPRSDRRTAVLGITVAAAIFAHLLMGNCTLDSRYVSYLWAIAAPVLVCFAEAYVRPGVTFRRAISLLLIVGLITAFVAYPGIYKALSLPLFSNAVYQQQFQMRRFVTESYPASVAVNDIGLVSYLNDVYVLDLFGLANREVLNARLTDTTSAWMETAARRHGTKYAILYDNWFPRGVPSTWRPVARMYRSTPIFDVAENKVVSVYAVDTSQVGMRKLTDALRSFAPSLPFRARLEILAPDGAH